MPAGADARIQELNLTLPPPPKPMALYHTALEVGGLLYTAGHGPVQSDGSLITGKVGEDLTLEQGKAAARQVGLAMLATLRSHLGSLDKVKRIVKALGMVACPASFTEQPQVLNGFSELMKEVFGDQAGVGTRSAVGLVALPANMAVEIEAVFEIE